MARDRKRAKQRRQRQAPQPARSRSLTPGAEPAARDADPQASESLAAIEPVDVAAVAPAPDADGDEVVYEDASTGAEITADELAPTKREGNRTIGFLRACWSELKRVQWPDRRQVTQATWVVLGFVVVAGGYLGLLDGIFARLVDRII